MSVVAFGPELDARSRFDELGCDAKTVTRPAHAALDEERHAKPTGDFREIDGLMLESKGRVAGDDEQRPEAGEAGNDLVGDAVTEIALRTVAAQVGEREHRHRWPIGSPKAGGSRLGECLAGPSDARKTLCMPPSMFLTA